MVERSARMIALACFAVVALSTSASAQGWPTRNVTMIIPWPPAGSSDIVGRAVAAAMATELKVPIVIENRDGASGTIGSGEVARAEANGYIIGFTPLTPITQAPLTTKGLPYTMNDFEFVCNVFGSVHVAAVKESSPYRSFADLRAAASSGGKPLTYSHAGIGSTGHLALADAASSLGMNFTHVPFRGGAPAVTAIMTGEVDVGSVAIPSVNNQQFRMLAVFDDKRSALYPNVPTAAEAGIPNPLGPMPTGVIVRKGTPPEIKARLEQACQKAVESDGVKKVAASTETDLEYQNSEGFQRRAQALNEKMKVILGRLDMLAK